MPTLTQSEMWEEEKKYALLGQVIGGPEDKEDELE